MNPLLMSTGPPRGCQGVVPERKHGFDRPEKGRRAAGVEKQLKQTEVPLSFLRNSKEAKGIDGCGV